MSHTNVVGKVIFHSLILGKVFLFVKENVIIVGGMLLLLIFFFVAMKQFFRKGKEDDDEEANGRNYIYAGQNQPTIQ